MSLVWLRWVPAVAVPAAIVAGAIIAPLGAGASPGTASATPQQVIALIAQSDTHPFSGVIQQSADLGLPALPTTGPGSNAGASSVLELLTGSHTARVYADGPTKIRAQILDSLAERDTIRNGTSVWTYNSKDNSATHVTLPDRATVTSEQSGAATTPAQLAERLLSAAGPSTSITVGGDTSLIGRPVYTLQLAPKTTATLIGTVTVLVDQKTGIPLSVQLDARGQSKPAFSVAYSAFSTDTPAASLFSFTPPQGTKVTQEAAPTHKPGAPAAPTAAKPKPAISGTGWATIAELPAGASMSSLTKSPLFAQATNAVAGGRALSTSLVSLLLTNDGRVFVGAVPVSALQAAAAAH